MPTDSEFAWRPDLSVEEIRRMASALHDMNADLPNIVVTPESNLFYVGDLHGELKSAIAVRELMARHPKHSVVFLGDYADRGPQQVETFNLVMSLALEHSDRVFMLRGNHESKEIAEVYGFYSEVSRHYSPGLFDSYLKVFESLPLAAFSPSGVFACHGGIPEGVNSSEQIAEIERHNINFPDDIAFQMVWNDPREADFHFRASSRSDRAREFGSLAFDEFTSDLSIKLIVRSHEVYEDGFQEFFDGGLMSVFSASYAGRVSPKVIRMDEGLKVRPVSI
ncbi:MAG: hypothetical protein C4K49_06850 [Candidatus Thorarchaeota archaeon]|nr:MAG: hypothetical protein C4K49_06850 [Candidatus Thorarchaeota archaeon]